MAGRSRFCSGCLVARALLVPLKEARRPAHDRRSGNRVPRRFVFPGGHGAARSRLQDRDQWRPVEGSHVEVGQQLHARGTRHVVRVREALGRQVHPPDRHRSRTDPERPSRLQVPLVLHDRVGRPSRLLRRVHARTPQPPVLRVGSQGLTDPLRSHDVIVSGRRLARGSPRYRSGCRRPHRRAGHRPQASPAISSRNRCG
jgi:hypothetical protein